LSRDWIPFADEYSGIPLSLSPSISLALFLADFFLREANWSAGGGNGDEEKRGTPFSKVTRGGIREILSRR